MNNFIVSFTTIPSRLKNIPSTIDKIKKQTLQPSVIYVCIPYFSSRNHMEYNIPSDWNFDDNIKIVRCNDYGPATKLLGCISYVKTPDIIIITIDDDQIYVNNMFETLVNYGKKYPESAICFRALDINLIDSHACNTKYDIITSPEVFYIQGFAGALYRRKFISNDMLKYFEED